MICRYSSCRCFTAVLLFFCTVFFLVCSVSAGGILSVSGLELSGEPLYLVCAQDKKLVLPFRIACLSKLVSDHTHPSSVKLDLSESLAHKLITLVYYAHALSTHKRVDAQVEAAYQQITFEDIAQLTSSIDQLQFADEFTEMYAKLVIQKFFTTRVLTECAKSKDYMQKLFAYISDEYRCLMIKVLCEQYGYLFWGALHTLARMDIDEADNISLTLNNPPDALKVVTSILAHKQSTAQDSRVLLCYKLIQQGPILILVTSNGQNIVIEFYYVKSNRLFASITIDDLSSHNSSYGLYVSPDLLTITLTTFSPDLEKARLKLGDFTASKGVEAVKQIVDISYIVNLTPAKELFFLLICEHAKMRNEPIDQAYVKYFSDDRLSCMRKAILRYKSISYTSAQRRCSIS